MNGREDEQSEHPPIPSDSTIGLIAGNGNFPLLVLDEARRRGIQVVAIAIKGEADPGVEHKEAAEVHWIGLGEVSRCIKLLKKAGVKNAIMAGQVKHKQIFRTLKPDPGLFRVLSRLRTRNTDAILGAVADVLAEEGIHLMDSTTLLRPLIATPGAMGKRRPSGEENKDIEFGLRVARELARLDIGQTVVVKGQAVVAVEAMEGTDETIKRAGAIVQGGLTVVKVARLSQDMRFDVPVVGPGTVDAMVEAGGTVLAVQAGKSLLLERETLIDKADRAEIAILGVVSQQ